MAGAPGVIGVVGAGTMGTGIAQLAARSGARTLLHDPVADALDRALATLREAGIDGVEAVRDVGDLAECDLVIEAAPERLELKAALFGDLLGVVGPGCVLATNTSSLSVTEIAASTDAPERVVGLHFFNPAPRMKLVEVVAGEHSSSEAVATARAAAEAMGKHVIDARDVAGFLVNRVNRPFSLEALKLVEEGIATPEQVDRICRMGGGFRMGPFELMDLIGIDTNHAVAEAFHRQSYGEPRYRPSPLAARKVAAGHLGRKTGRGWYAYPEGRPDDPEPPPAGGGEGRAVAVEGQGPVAEALRDAAGAAGFALSGGEPWLTVACDGPSGATGPRLLLLDSGSLHAQDPEAMGFHVAPPFAGTTLAQVTTTRRTGAEALDRAPAFFAALGLVVERVGDAPGLVLGRILAQLANEATFLVDEGNGRVEDVDAGLRLGLNHPRGPFAWTGLVGRGRTARLLAALARELGEPRYRAARSLRDAAALGD